MTHTLAIPVFGHRVSARLDCAHRLLITMVEDGRIIRRTEIPWEDGPAPERIHNLIRRGVEILICDGLSDTWSLLLAEQGIEVIPWTRGEVEDVLVRFLLGDLYTHADSIAHRRES